MKKWVVRIVNADTGRVRNATTMADTKQQAVDKVRMKDSEYVAFCYAESEG